jgi:hypothetical protein
VSVDGPYAPPQSAAGERPPADVRLFGPAAIFAHALLLSPVAGGILAAINHRRRGNGRALKRTILLFVAPGALVDVCLFVGSGPLSPVVRVLGACWMWGAGRMLYWEHAPLVQGHVDAGGKKARWYLATFAMVAVFVATALITGIVMALRAR